MNRRDTKESIRKVFRELRERIPGLVLRTSIIAGLPGEGEKEFEELCDFLREEKIERAGVFPFSPEEGDEGRDDGARSDGGGPAPHGAFSRRAERYHRRIQ